MNPEIFRAYDIRGVVDVDFHPGDIERLGRAIATYAHERGYEEIVVGRDNRLSSPPLRDALVKGLVASGAHVLDIGIVTTPILYHTIHTRLPHPSGVMITGSHNPPEYNGFKICIGKAAIFGEEIARLHRMIEGGAFREAQGRVTELPGIIARYQEDLASRIKLDRPLHIVVDAGNGTAGPVAPELFRRLGCTVVERYCELDGRYPNHHPDPTDPANLEDLIATVRREGADLGLAFDGDADRLGVIDETGRILWGDQLLVIYGREVIAKGFPKVIFEVKCSQTLVEAIEAAGGEPILWKTGHSLIKQKMRETGAGLAGEMSGHLFFADEYFGFDDAIYAACRLLRIVAGKGIPLSAHLADLPKTCTTPELRIDCPDDKKFAVVEAIARHYAGRRETITIDGVRAIFPEGWGLVRASNTQPVLVARFEAKSPEGLERIRGEMLGLLERHLRGEGLPAPPADRR